MVYSIGFLSDESSDTGCPQMGESQSPSIACTLLALENIGETESFPLRCAADRRSVLSRGEMASLNSRIWDLKQHSI